MTETYWILDGHEPKPVDSMTWAKWFGKANRIVKAEEIGNIMVSTVFLGSNHNYDQNGPLHIFETLIFGGKYDGDVDRCATWAEAEKMHKKAVAKILSRHHNKKEME